MDKSNIERIYTSYHRQLENTPMNFKRYLFDQINWEDRLIGLKGARGVGKTTLLLQHVIEDFKDVDKALYVSMDNLWLLNNSIIDLVEYHSTHGGTHIFLDEIHRLPLWQTTLKNLYDEFPQLHIVYTGSSMLEIDNHQGDLSRRQIIYQLHGMSFREFLELKYGIKSEVISISELLENHVRTAMDLVQHTQILPAFEEYLKYGYYPFFKDVHNGFDLRLQEIVRQVIETDVPAVENLEFTTIDKIKKMLLILAENVPQTPNMNLLYKELETNREQGLKMLYTLQRAALISILGSKITDMKHLTKPEKIYLDNSNLMYALSSTINIGTVRETFFLNQVKQVAKKTLPRKGDFLLDGKYLFEVGGKSKTFNQIKDIPNSYLAVDDTETGYMNRIPLWMFGMLY